MSAFEITLSICIVASAIVVILFLSISNEPCKQKSNGLKIAKTITSLDYTGKDFEKWIEQIKIERQILSVKNESDFLLNLKLRSNLINENIFTPTK